MDRIMIAATHSGAGKTTILNTLGGMDTIDSGHIYVDNKDISKLNSRELTNYRRHDVGFVFQFYNLMPQLTALDNVEIASELCLSPLNPKEVLKEVGLEDRIHNFPSQLSGGEQQLVFIARVLTQEPSILILDEPTSHLDFGNQIRTLNIIKKLASKGLSVIMSSHFPDHAFISANKVALMDGKKFLAMGKPEDVITTENMKQIYGIDVKVMDIGKRMACIP